MESGGPVFEAQILACILSKVSCIRIIDIYIFLAFLVEYVGVGPTREAMIKLF
jgi:hypothetical protein